MNEHIRRGIEALKSGDRDLAEMEFCEALTDSDPLSVRIARNKLYDMFPEGVFASTHSYGNLYHRPSCAAKNVIESRHIFWFRDWRQAEAAGRSPCSICRPIRTEPYIPQGY
jgi:methylphosphotriester-DNA--protein-cysteine methyltransferase